MALERQDHHLVRGVDEVIILMEIAARRIR